MKKVLFTFILLLSVLVLAPYSNVYAAINMTKPTNAIDSNYILFNWASANNSGYTNYATYIGWSGNYKLVYDTSTEKLYFRDPNTNANVSVSMHYVYFNSGSRQITSQDIIDNPTIWNNVLTDTFPASGISYYDMDVFTGPTVYKIDGTSYYENIPPYPTQEELINGTYTEGIYFYEPKGSQNFIKGITYNGKIYFDVPITYNTLGIAAPLDTIKENLITYLNSNMKSKFDFYLKDSTSNIIPMNISITGLNVTTTFNDNNTNTSDKYRGYLDFKFSVNNTGNFTIVSKLNAPSNLKNTFIPLYQWFTWETVSYKMYETTRVISVSENIADSNNDGKDDTSGNTIVIPPAPTPIPSGNTTTTTETGSGTTITITNTNNVSSSSSSGTGSGTTQPTIDSAQAVSNFTQVGGYFTAFSGFLGEIISFLPLEVKALIIAAAGIIFVICIKRAILA